MQKKQFATYLLLIFMVVSLASAVRFVSISNAAPLPPVASFTYSPTAPSVGSTTTFDASASYSPNGTITNYQWNFGDGNAVNTSNPIITHVYTLQGTYGVNLVVIDNYTSTDSINTNIEVSPAIPWLEIQPTQQLVLSEHFQVNIDIKHLAQDWNMFGVQFNLNYDPNLLNYSNATAGSFWNAFAWTTSPPYTYIVAQPRTGYVLVAVGLLGPGAEPAGYVFPNGNGTIAVLQFQATSNVQMSTSYPISFTIDNVLMGSFDPVTGNIAQFPNYDSVGANYNIRIDAPVPIFTYSPLGAVMGEILTFDASNSYSTSFLGNPTITNYAWTFGDGATGTGMIVTHVFANPTTYDVTLTVTDNNGNSRSITQTVPVQRSFVTVNVDASSMYFRGEVVDFYMQTAILGKPVDVDSGTAVLYYGNQQLDLSSQVQHIGTGLYKVSYTIPTDAYEGTWSFVAEAQYLSMAGSGLRTFSISPTLTNWNAQLVGINSGIATIQTSVGVIRTNLTAINAQLVGVNNGMATIQTNVGVIQTNLTTINARIIDVSNGVATMQTDIGTIKASVTELNNKIPSPIQNQTPTDIGSIAMILYVVVILSAIAAVVASLLYFLPRRHQQ
jgi:PKD repeat protein